MPWDELFGNFLGDKIFSGLDRAAGPGGGGGGGGVEDEEVDEEGVMQSGDFPCRKCPWE